MSVMAAWGGKGEEMGKKAKVEAEAKCVDCGASVEDDSFATVDRAGNAHCDPCEHERELLGKPASKCAKCGFENPAIVEIVDGQEWCDGCFCQKEEREMQERFDAADPQVKALAQHIDCDVADISEEGVNTYRHGSRYYLVLTDDEADAACAQQIRESLWACRVAFIARYTEPRLNERAQNALLQVVSDLCEDANDLVLALVRDLDGLVRDIISEDGRGGVLATYDGDEDAVTVDRTNYYIYRTN